MPIIIVGNITVGGTGKTPLVIWLANYLKEQGFNVGIVSRGYGGKNIEYPCDVKSDSNPQQVGDEALLIVRNTHCPMVVDPDRVRAVTKLLELHNCNVVISDDGLQHLALGRDVEIVVVDGARQFGNGFCLPAGPLREPVKRLQTVDFVVVNANASSPSKLVPGFVGLTKSVQVNSRSAQGAPATEPTITMQLIANDLHQITNPNSKQKPEYFKNKTIHAVAGIGHPQRFFNSLHTLGLTTREHPFPDHYDFQPKDFAFAKPDDIIIMTEKDAVKCEKFADERYWYLPVRAEMPDDFGARVIAVIAARK